jgi:crotonobetaine/carnitine-CoA ligase
LGDGLPFEHVVVRDEAGVLDLAAPGAGQPAGDGGVHYGDTAAVLWTSGTTGRSKGVMQSHNAWLRGAESGATTSGAREGDVLYSCLPMHNSAAWVAVVYRALVCGLPFGLDPRFSVADFWDRVRFYGATQTFTLGAMHVFLWKQPERPDDALNPVRVASCVPMPEPLLEPFKRRFAIEQIYQGYGQSEVLGLLSRVDDGRRRWSPNTAGVPLAGIDVRLLDDDDREVEVGEVGELCVRPTEPYVLFNGYFNDAEATLRAGRNLWYHTGDLGRRNEEGEYFFFDRKADYIRYKGRSVSSFAVEAAVTAHPAVAECAAYGITSAELESEAEIKVDVVAKPGACVKPDELARFVNDNAPYFFVPRYIELVAELPHTPTGRVQKYLVRRRGVTEATWDRDAAGFVVHR